MELRRYAVKGSATQQVQEAKLDTGSGMEGDYHKNVSLLTRTAALWMESLDEPGLCFEKLKANILLDGSLSHGSHLSFAEVILHVRPQQKYCFASCVYRQNGFPCPLAAGVFFADVLQGGTLRVGELGSIVSLLELSANPGVDLE